MHIPFCFKVIRSWLNLPTGCHGHVMCMGDTGCLAIQGGVKANMQYLYLGCLLELHIRKKNRSKWTGSYTPDLTLLYSRHALAQPKTGAMFDLIDWTWCAEHQICLLYDSCEFSHHQTGIWNQLSSISIQCLHSHTVSTSENHYKSIDIQTTPANSSSLLLPASWWWIQIPDQTITWHPGLKR